MLVGLRGFEFKMEEYPSVPGQSAIQEINDFELFYLSWATINFTITNFQDWNLGAIG